MIQQVITSGWEDYELLATGDGLRTERFGEHIITRAEPNVLWAGGKASSHPAVAVFQAGEWKVTHELKKWKVTWKECTFNLKLTPFRHVGIFPEQAANWQWLGTKISNAIASGRTVRVLNLFAYTGGASMVSALAGAEVCHVDASKGVVQWASENARASGVPADRIRWIVDDVRKFVAREVKRGAKYDLILLDPPVFGRGTKGEVWRLEEDLASLLKSVAQLYSAEPLGFLLNFYATEVYPEAIARMAQQIMPSFQLELAELCLSESKSEALFQTGYIVRA